MSLTSLLSLTTQVDSASRAAQILPAPFKSQSPQTVVFRQDLLRVSDGELYPDKSDSGDL